MNLQNSEPENSYDQSQYHIKNIISHIKLNQNYYFSVSKFMLLLMYHYYLYYVL